MGIGASRRVEKRWLESEPQACGKNLATGGAEGSQEANLSGGGCG